MKRETMIKLSLGLCSLVIGGFFGKLTKKKAIEKAYEKAYEKGKREAKIYWEGRLDTIKILNGEIEESDSFIQKVMRDEIYIDEI